MQRPEENRKLRPLASLIKEIDRKLTDIEDERSVLLYLRNLAMKEVSKAIGGGSTGGWDEKGVVNQLVDENEKGMRDKFRGLNMGDAWVGPYSRNSKENSELLALLSFVRKNKERGLPLC